MSGFYFGFLQHIPRGKRNFLKRSLKCCVERPVTSVGMLNGSRIRASDKLDKATFVAVYFSFLFFILLCLEFEHI